VYVCARVLIMHTYWQYDTAYVCMHACMYVCSPSTVHQAQAVRITAVHASVHMCVQAFHTVPSPGCMRSTCVCLRACVCMQALSHCAWHSCMTPYPSFIELPMGRCWLMGQTSDPSSSQLAWMQSSG